MSFFKILKLLRYSSKEIHLIVNRKIVKFQSLKGRKKNKKVQFQFRNFIRHQGYRNSLKKLSYNKI